jgi:hypothetical protein
MTDRRLSLAVAPLAAGVWFLAALVWLVAAAALLTTFL